MGHFDALYYCLFEHQRVSAVAIAGRSDITVLPAATFAWLLQQLESSRNCFVFEAVRGVPVIKFQQYVGVLRCPDGVVLEILPKVFRHDDTPEAARAILLKMLAASPEMTPLLHTAAAVQLAKMPLLEVFLQLALDSFAQVIQRGLRRDYRTEQGNLPTLRGRLLISQHLQHNLTNQAQFFTAHDDYTSNRAENRLLKSAVLLANRIARSAKQQRLAHELLLRMGDVPASLQPAQDWRAVRLDRNMSDYRPALAWVKILLDHHSPLINAGQQEALSLWFDMNQLFERYVLVCLSRNLPTGHQLLAQSREKTVLHRQLTGKLEQHGRLKPDLLYQINGKTEQVLDTKWKLLNTPNPMQSVSPADLYQMQAYAAAYLPAGGQVCLIYPKTERFAQPVIGWRFCHLQGGQVELRLIPFCLLRGDLVLASA